LSKIQSKPSKTSIPFQVGKTTGINFTRVRELDSKNRCEDWSRES